MRVEKFRRDDIGGLAGTDGLRIYLDVARLNELPEEDLNFILLHELFHIILRHKYTRGLPNYERKYWNIAFDLYANWLMESMKQDLKRAGIPFQPLSGSIWTSDNLEKDPSHIIAQAFVGQALAQGILTDNPPPFIEIEWKNFKHVEPNFGGFALDVLEGEGSSESEPTDSEVTALLKDAAKAAGNSGLPKHLRDLWGKLSKGRSLPWYLLLKRYLQGLIESDDMGFCPPDKRVLYDEKILPADSWSTGIELRNALVVIDVSGSVSKEELTKQLWQLKVILSELDFQGEIITFASDVIQVGKIGSKASLKKFVDEMQVGGGTSWESVVKWVKARRVQPRPIIVFTDGEFFEFTKGLSDVIFILQEENRNPFGNELVNARLQEVGKVITIKNKN